MTELHTESNLESYVLPQEDVPAQADEQNDLGYEHGTDKGDSGTGETGSDLATEKGVGKDKGVNQDAVQNAINKQHAKFREEERKRKSLEKELEELRSRQPKEPEAPIVPDAPDPYDENYEELVKVRDQKLLEKAKYDISRQAEAERHQKLVAEKQEVRQKEVAEMIKSYNNRTEKLGLSVADIHKSGQAIVDYGINEQLAEFILSDEDGPLLTKYLAHNPAELDELLSLPITNATIRMHTDIRQKVQGLKPKTSGTPDPAPVLSGNGAGEIVPSIIKNAVFE